MPFSFHWYDVFVPALTGVAINVTLVPGQNVSPGLAVMVREGSAFTIIITSFDSAFVGSAQARDDVSTQVILLPFANAAF